MRIEGERYGAAGQKQREGWKVHSYILIRPCSPQNLSRRNNFYSSRDAHIPRRSRPRSTYPASCGTTRTAIYWGSTLKYPPRVLAAQGLAALISRRPVPASTLGLWRVWTLLHVEVARAVEHTKVCEHGARSIMRYGAVIGMCIIGVRGLAFLCITPIDTDNNCGLNLGRKPSVFVS